MSPSRSGPRAISPYQAVLGEELEGPHPRLRTYFAAIPEGHSGRGEGEWERVGTPRRWLWPMLALLSSEGIAFPVWGEGVPFAVVNTPDFDGGGPAVSATRVFRFVDGERRMSDSIGVDHVGLVDRLGRSRRLHSRLALRIVDGELHMSSTALLVRVGGRLIRVPDAVAPRVSLVERFDDERGLQHVSLRLTAPVVGLVYEYAGCFDYRVERTTEA